MAIKKVKLINKKGVKIILQVLKQGRSSDRRDRSPSMTAHHIMERRLFQCALERMTISRKCYVEFTSESPPRAALLPIKAPVARVSTYWSKTAL